MMWPDDDQALDDDRDPRDDSAPLTSSGTYTRERCQEGSRRVGRLPRSIDDLDGSDAPCDGWRGLW